MNDTASATVTIDATTPGRFRILYGSHAANVLPVGRQWCLEPGAGILHRLTFSSVRDLATAWVRDLGETLPLDFVVAGRGEA